MMKKLQTLLFSISTLLGISNANPARAQLAFSDGFEEITTIWTDNNGIYYTVPEGFGACNGGSLVVDLGSWFAGYSWPLISPSLGISNGGQATVEYTYKIGMNPFAELPNDPAWGNLTWEYATSTEGPWIPVEMISPENHIVSANCATRTITFFPEADSEIFLRFSVTVNPDESLAIEALVFLDDVVVTQAAPCTAGAPEEISSPQDFCKAGTVGDLNTAGFFAIQWYADEIGGQPLSLTKPLAAGVYYASQITEGEDSCESAERTAVTVNLITTETPVIESPYTYEGTAPLVLYSIETEGEGTVTWYENEEDAQDSDDALSEDTELSVGGTYYATRTIDGCESEPVAVEIQVQLGNEDFNSAAFRYYPNPVKNMLYLSSRQDISAIAIYNLLGQEVAAYKKGSSQNEQIDISALETGAYIVKVTAGGTVGRIKIVKLN